MIELATSEDKEKENVHTATIRKQQ